MSQTPAQRAASIANLAKARAKEKSESASGKSTTGKRHLRSSKQKRKGVVRTRVIRGRRETSWLEVFKKDLY